MVRAKALPALISADGSEDRLFVIALARGLSVLKAFEAGDDLLTNAEIAKRTTLPKATITRLTYTLCQLGYLARDTSKPGYRLDPHILTLGFPVLAGLSVRALARPMLQALAEEEGVPVSLGLRDGTHMILIERVRSSAPVALQQALGTRVPIALTALGRGYIAGLGDTPRNALLEELRASIARGRWSSTIQGIERELVRYRKQGYCFGGAWDAELTGVALPLALPGHTLLSLACAGSRTRLPDARLAKLGERLKSIARRIKLSPENSL